jgi:hypothetical protein
MIRHVGLRVQIAKKGENPISSEKQFQDRVFVKLSMGLQRFSYSRGSNDEFSPK